MTATFLQSELTSLISDSKRKHGDIRAAAEKSLADLRSISVTSETQLSGDLVRKQHFVDPFLLACKSENVKLASTAAACLQRLIASSSIPNNRLSDVLYAFQDAVQLALEVQLKILQTLPSLLQLYAEDLHGETLAITLGVSAELAGSKAAVVSNTASATFQQLVAAVFERLASGKETTHQPEIERDNDTFDNTKDAALVFNDICALLSGAQPKFVRLSGLNSALVLETLETVIQTYGSDVMSMSVSLTACQTDLITGIKKLIEGNNNFGIVARAFRITFLLLTRYFSEMENELEGVLSMLLALLDRSTGASWKRILCLEMFRSFASDFDAIRTLFAAYDMAADRKSILVDLMAVLVRTAAEDPSLIGLGRQSTIPSHSLGEAGEGTGADIDLSGTNVGVGNVVQAETKTAGISADFSTIPVPCLDQVERANPPDIPNTYIYTLVLGCVAAVADGLSKFVMPLSIPNRKSTKSEDLDDVQEGEAMDRAKTHKYQQLVNPLKRPDSFRRDEILVCSKIIETCWPAVLATCSTFLNSALDSYFYHILIRTVQKLTQVSGVLELQTPRDALLTTLAKVSVPVNVSSLLNHLYGDRVAKETSDETVTDLASPSPVSPMANTPRQSIDLAVQSLNIRNLLCLRALLNLGIALGPTLSITAWIIILQSLQQVEALMNVNQPSKTFSTTITKQIGTDDSSQPSLGSEISAVETATRRMLDSTKTYTENAFHLLLKAVFEMSPDIFSEHTKSDTSLLSPSVGDGKFTNNRPSHKTSRSVSGSWTKNAVLEIEIQFVMKTFGKLAMINIHRFMQKDSATFLWNLVTGKLLHVQTARNMKANLRLQAANIADLIVEETSKAATKEQLSENTVEVYCLPFLSQQSEKLFDKSAPADSPVEAEIHRRLLEALESVLGQHGDSLAGGWVIALDILEQTVSKIPVDAIIDAESSKTLTAAFRIVQLIVSDFLPFLDNKSVFRLLQIARLFGTQQSDVNLALTTTALFWNVTSLLLERSEQISLPNSNLLSQLTIFQPTTTDEEQNAVLWHHSIVALARLCKHDRIDVRTAAIKMLQRALDTSSQQLSSLSLQICVTDILLPFIEESKAKIRSSSSEWRPSMLSVVGGTGSLISEKIELFAKGQNFEKAWKGCFATFAIVLSNATILDSAEVFRSISSILAAMKALNVEISNADSAKILTPVWELWYQHNPAALECGDVSNETAIAAYLQVLREMEFIDRVTLQEFIFKDKNLATKVLMQSVESSKHPKYSNDINKVTEDQEQICLVLELLERVFEKEPGVFADNLLQFINKCVELADQSPTDRKSHPNQSSKLKQPSYTALISRSLNILRNFVTLQRSEKNFSRDFPIAEALDLISQLTTRRNGQSNIQESSKHPLRRNASVTGIEIIVSIQQHRQWLASHGEKAIGEPIHDIVQALISPEVLDVSITNLSKPSIVEFETEDIAFFHRAHDAALSLLKQSAYARSWRVRYIISLFRSSLVARPWFKDFPTDLENHPLEQLNNIRRGSIKDPEFPPRENVHIVALDALLDLVAKPQSSNHNKQNETSNSNATLLASTAAPYVLLRLAHPFKVFLADQPLRYLDPPHPALQNELRVILTRALNLRVNDEAFQNLKGVSKRLVQHDGKTHLRLLYPLILRFERFWNELPRLPAYAWQDDEDGLAVVDCLKKWTKTLSKGWGLGSESEDEEE